MVSNAIETGTAAEQAAENTRRQNIIVPPVDILEDKDNYIFLADMPGVAPENVDVTFENGILTLEGRAGDVPARDGLRVLVREYHRGTYRRSFAVDAPINADDITAKLVNGELTVHVPKAASAKTRKITVNAG